MCFTYILMTQAELSKWSQNLCKTSEMVSRKRELVDPQKRDGCKVTDKIEQRV